jgi:hypothetical protein
VYVVPYRRAGNLVNVPLHPKGTLSGSVHASGIGRDEGLHSVCRYRVADPLAPSVITAVVLVESLEASVTDVLEQSLERGTVSGATNISAIRITRDSSSTEGQAPGVASIVSERVLPRLFVKRDGSEAVDP